MGRPPCCDKSNVKRGPWTDEEDAKILAYVASHGIGNWTLVPQKAGLNRCGKSCRLRWTNYLRPDLKHDTFTPEEEECILELHKTVGSRWSLIAKRLPGRTDNDVKNFWNTKLKKKLMKMGIDPVTHKPFSQLYTEYGKISGVTNMNPFLHTFTRKEEPYDLMSRNDPMDSMAYRFQVVSNNQSHYYNEASSSSNGVMLFGSTSSGSCESSQVGIVPCSSSPFECNEYILGDPLFPNDNMDQMQECKYMGTLSNSDSITVQETGTSCSRGTGAAESFVDTILAYDDEMRLQFPNNLDGIYDY